MQPDMNSMMRSAGNRSRSLPNIGQTPAVRAADMVLPAGAAGAAGAAQAMQNPQMPTQGLALQMPPQQGGNPYAAPQQAAPMTMVMHPPGTPADPNQYNYEPQPDGAWRVYPPGVAAPPHQPQASLPRAASTADYRRMRQAFQAPPQF
jgi:hypothetical protein